MNNTILLSPMSNLNDLSPSERFDLGKFDKDEYAASQIDTTKKHPMFNTDDHAILSAKRYVMLASSTQPSIPESKFMLNPHDGLNNQTLNTNKNYNHETNLFHFQIMKPPVSDPLLLVSRPYNNDFKKFKQFATSCDSFVLGKLFIGSAKFGIIRNIEYLMSKKNNFSIMDYDLDTAFNESAKNGHLTVMLFLLDNGADIENCDHFALRNAVSEGRVEILNALISRGANINIDDGILLLTSTNLNDNVDVLTVLLFNNIDISIYYDIILDRCITRNYTKCSELLLSFVTHQ